MDLWLTRSRLEAELASTATHCAKLRNVSALVVASHAERAIECVVEPHGGSIRLSLDYARGEANVSVAALELTMGQSYAVVGRNGGGKSSLFALAMACADGVPAPASIEVSRLDRFVLPSRDVALVPQKGYCPLHSRPVDWLRAVEDGEAAGSLLRGLDDAALAARFAELAKDLRWNDESAGGDDALVAWALEEAEDFCGALSGGQRSKYELIRRVLAPRSDCPAVLLMDEVLSPLDPRSKKAVHRVLRERCPASLMLTIFHADGEPAAGDGAAGDEGGESGDAIDDDDDACHAMRSGMFDGVVEFVDGAVSVSTGGCRGQY